MALAAFTVSAAWLIGGRPIGGDRGWQRRRGGPCCSDSRSTFAEEAESFHVGARARRVALDAELAVRGLSGDELAALLESADHRGSPAFRAYNSFVYPKSEGALANAEKAGRLATVAQAVCFLHREQKAEHATWLRNHDRTLAEADAANPGRFPLTLVLDNIRSAHNVGSLLRAAEAARVESVHLCGITPAPPHASVLKTALGAAEYVPHERSPSTLATVRGLQARGVAVWAAETCPGRSVDLREAALPQPLALVLGNELIGVDTQVLDACDGVVSIPMFGVKNSINVATAGAIVLWEALRQWEVSAEAEGAGLGQMRSQRAERPRPERAEASRRARFDKSNSRQA